MFATPAGTRVPAVTADEMAAVDRAAEARGLAVVSMMESAGRALAETVREVAADRPDGSGGVDRRSDGPVVVLAGAGGNGGGGLCAARHLANAGHEVRVVLDRDPADLTGAAATQHRILGATDATVGTDAAALAEATVVVDALVGYGLTGALRGRAAELVDAVPRVPTVSLDVPSGVDADTGAAPSDADAPRPRATGDEVAGDDHGARGRETEDGDRSSREAKPNGSRERQRPGEPSEARRVAPGPAVDPDRTLTLALPKPGLATAGGDLELADLGIPAGVYETAGVAPSHPFDGALRTPLDRI